MPVRVNGFEYLSVSEVASRLGVSRQTLWRWRQEPGMPQGHRFRGRQVVFSQAEFEALKVFANRLEPVDGASGDQLRLFDSEN